MLETVTLDQLRVFLAVCDAGSFTAAAKRLKRAQSAISYAVVSLEGALELALFDRTGHAPVLTEVGRALVTDARSVVARADELRSRARSMTGGLELRLEFAVDMFFPRLALITGLKDFHAEFPLLPLVVHTEGLAAVAKLVFDGKCHVGISVVPDNLPKWETSLERRFLMSVEMVAVVALDSPLGRHGRAVTRHELKDHVQLVLTDRTPLTAGFQGGVLNETVWRLADLGTKHDLLLAGFGWGNMPLHMVTADLAEGRLRRLEFAEQPGGPGHLQLAEVFRRADPPGPAGRWLIERLRDLVTAKGEERLPRRK
jgi:DNA-binding transcriptional LysR family regulator